MSKTTLLAISIILLSAVVWMLHFNQDQEIENHWEQVKYNSSEIDKLRNQIDNDLKESQIRLDESAKYNKFQEALNKIDKNDYSEDYNCYEFTKDLQKELAKLDIKSYIAITKNREHAHLLVPVEATEGRFLGIDNNYEIMEIRDIDLEVLDIEITNPND